MNKHYQLQVFVGLRIRLSVELDNQIKGRVIVQVEDLLYKKLRAQLDNELRWKLLMAIYGK